MYDFMVGDRVIIVSEEKLWKKNLFGEQGIIIYIALPQICIEFDNHVDGHNGSLGNEFKGGKQGHCFWVFYHNIDKINKQHRNIKETIEIRCKSLYM